MVLISLMGGLVGALTTNTRKALDEKIAQQNQDGYKALQITQHGTTNLFIRVLQLLVLVVTLGLFTWAGGYLLLFEKE